MTKFNKILTIFLLGLLFLTGSVRAQPGERKKYSLVRMETAYGECIVMLYNITPLHRDNFLKLVKAKFFDQTTFNRIIKDFVVQGGDPDSLYMHKEKLNEDQYWMKAELHESLFHKRGALGMGRDDNAAKDSFSTQFYLVTGKTWTDAELDAVEKKTGRAISAVHREAYKSVGGLPYLDGDYTVFGQVLKGMDVVEKLSALPVDKDGKPDKEVWMRLSAVENK